MSLSVCLYVCSSVCLSVCSFVRARARSLSFIRLLAVLRASACHFPCFHNKRSGWGFKYVAEQPTCLDCQCLGRPNPSCIFLQILRSVISADRRSLRKTIKAGHFLGHYGLQFFNLNILVIQRKQPCIFTSTIMSTLLYGCERHVSNTHFCKLKDLHLLLATCSSNRNKRYSTTSWKPRETTAESMMTIKIEIAWPYFNVWEINVCQSK